MESGDDGGLGERGEARIPGLYRILEVGFVCLFLHLRQPRSGPKYVDDSNQASVLRGCWSSSMESGTVALTSEQLVAFRHDGRVISVRQDLEDYGYRVLLTFNSLAARPLSQSHRNI